MTEEKNNIIGTDCQPNNNPIPALPCIIGEIDQNIKLNDSINCEKTCELWEELEIDPTVTSNVITSSDNNPPISHFTPSPNLVNCEEGYHIHTGAKIDINCNFLLLK